MSDESGQEAFELERKYEAGIDASIPSAAQFLQAGFDPDPAETHELVATYFDTPQRDLAALGMALRSREGGHDAGWHLKQRLSEGVREFMWPPSTTMPVGVIAALAEHIGERASLVVPAAEIRTTRIITMLRITGQQAASIELADDHVFAVDHAAGVKRAWREWEAELIPGADAALLNQVEPLLLTAGATHSLSFAKIARATGQLADVARAAGATASQLAALSALDASDRAAAQE